MLKLFSVAQMRAAEQAADAAGVSFAQMMEAAGAAVAEAIAGRVPPAGRTVTVLVGPGNNGGDGLVAGRYLAQAGAEVAFYLAAARPADDPNLAAAHELGLQALSADFDQRFRVLRTRLNVTDILVDALLGTGVSRPIEGALARLLAQVKAGVGERRAILAEQARPRLVAPGRPPAGEGQAGRDLGSGRLALPGPTPSIRSASYPGLLIAAVDCPSGLNCDSGALDELSLAADLTVTFAGPKRGHFTFPGAAACGELVVADIGIPADLEEVKEIPVQVVTAGQARAWLPPRPRDGHKGSFGRVLVAGGSARYLGAPALAGRAAYRAGAGLVALAVPAGLRPALAGQLPEATYPLLPAAEELDAPSARALLEMLGDYQALLVGPGLGGAAAFFEALLARPEALPPLVVDADGLNLLAKLAEWPSRLPAGSLLTPHPVEMARLMGISADDVKGRDRLELAQAKAAEWGHVVVLKGAYTIIAAPDGRAAVLPFAEPALATAGSGDVLAGVVAALLGQGLAAFEAAALGGYLAAAAGASAGVEAGLLASEIADRVPAVWAALRGDRPDAIAFS
ncbi:MAG: NAD(P)H-hydrate dehydratase [Candidatus Promineifilaceae bacterium]